MNLLKKYENFILTNASQISSIESSLKTLTYVLPGRFADAEFASEAYSSKTYQYSSFALTLLQNTEVLLEMGIQKKLGKEVKWKYIGIISELLYIIRPLIYVLTLRKYGNKSWKPWLLSIIIEVYTRILTNYFHKKISDGSHRLTSVEKDEEKRRIKQLFLYILRGPFYEKITRPKIDKICQSVGNKPILSLFGGILRDYQPIWENVYFYKNTDTSNKSSQQQSPEEKRSQIDPEIIDYILGKSDAVYMKEAIEVISNTEETIENRKIAFDNLEMLVEQIDNAVNIENMNLWPKLISFLSLPEVPLRILAVWVCGTAVQNNPKAQKAFAEHGGIKVILDILNNLDEDLEVKSKALYAISGAIKHFKSGLEQFDKYNGYDTLLFLLKSSDKPTVVANRIEEKGLAKQMIKLLKTFGEKDGDLAEKILKVLLAEFLYSSKLISQEGIKELKEVLPEIKRKYGEDTLSTEEWIELEKQIDKL
ncbi:1201_t:CDS:10, partial [Entrophospora sp. SA101]